LAFQNRIKGEDPNNFISGLVFDNVRFNNGLLTNENRITSGEMDNGNWVSVPNGTDHTTTFCSTCGTGNDWGLLSKTTNMNAKPYYTNVCNDEFHIDNNEMITVSFWARATADGKLLTPFVQDVVTGDMKEFPQVSLTTNFTRYSSTIQVDKTTSDHYKLKFRGFSTAWIYLDKIQVGRKDWITLTNIDKQYVNTPTFLPNLQNFASTSQELSTLKSTQIAPKIAPDVKKEFEVYPTSGILELKGANENTCYKIYSMNGNMVLSGQGNQVEISKLINGVYVLITDGNERMKFIKK
jgi:hypothetical protein